MAADKKRVVSRKKRELKKVDKGQVHIQSTFNNTLVTITDMNGNAISWSSAGPARPRTEHQAQRAHPQGTAPYGCEQEEVRSKRYGSR